MGIFTAIMAVCVILTTAGLGFFLDGTNRLQAFPIIIAGVVVGVLVYAALSLKSKLANRLFGEKVDWLKRKLGV